MFGNNLIWELDEEVSFTLDEDTKHKRVMNFCDRVENVYGEYELSRFIYSQSHSFYENRVDIPYTFLDIIIPKGAKIVRAFKEFINDDFLLRKLQDEASELIQEDKICGKLCLSVHPLDFLSSSETKHRWRSCHSLDGEYRAGNLSYMLDKTTFMAYIKSEEDVILPNFPPTVPWNNKKWRCLFFLSSNRDMMFAGRQYPFNANAAIDKVKDLIAEKLHIKFTEWCDNRISEYTNPTLGATRLRTPYIGLNSSLIKLDELIIDPETPLHYNDLLHSTCYIPKYCYKYKETIFGDEMNVSKNTRFYVGANVPCPCCNEQFITMSQIMTCTDCELKYGNSDSEDFATCPNCGSRFLYDDGFFIDLSFETVCPNCGEEAVACEICGDYGFPDSSDMFYNKKLRGYVCCNCHTEEEEEDDG